MSTPTIPSQPAGSWFPNLEGLKLPRPLTSGLQQGFTLIYSLRDTVNQIQTALSKTVQYGRSEQRAQVKVESVPDGALWFEIDTGDIYQSRLVAKTNTRQWVLAAHGVPQPG